MAMRPPDSRLIVYRESAHSSGFPGQGFAGPGAGGFPPSLGHWSFAPFFQLNVRFYMNAAFFALRRMQMRGIYPGTQIWR